MDDFNHPACAGGYPPETDEERVFCPFVSGLQKQKDTPPGTHSMIESLFDFPTVQIFTSLSFGANLNCGGKRAR